MLIGAGGKQGREYWDQLSDVVRWVGIAESEPTKLDFIPNGSTYVAPSWEDLVGQLDFELAVVTLPHRVHLEATLGLLNAGKHVIKEKPFAVTTHDAQALIESATANDRSVYTIVQRPFLPAFRHLENALGLVGAPFWFLYQYHINLASATSGWRAVREISCGGALLDMGYHAVDILVRCFGPPNIIRSRFSYCFDEMQDNALEDTADLAFTYTNTGLQGTVHISRHHYRKLERFEVLARNGSVVATPSRVETFYLGGDRETSLKDIGFQKHRREVKSMFQHYLRNLDNRSARQRHLRHHLTVVSVIESAYRSGRPGGNRNEGDSITMPNIDRRLKPREGQACWRY